MSAPFAFSNPTGSTPVDALLFGTRWVADGGVAVTYSFPGLSSVWDVAAYGKPGEPYSGFARFGSAEQQAVNTAMLAWSSVANIGFLQTPDDSSGQGSIRFAYTSYGMDPTQ